MIKIFKHFYPIRKVFFVLGEGIIIYFSTLFAYIIVSPDIPYLGSSAFQIKILLITLCCQISLYLMNLYNLPVSDSNLQVGLRLIQALGLSAVFLGIIYLVFPQTIVKSSIFAISASVIVLLITSWRLAYQALVQRGYLEERVILLGSGRLAKHIKEEVKIRQDCGFHISMIVPEIKSSKQEKQTDISEVLDSILRNGYEGLCSISSEMKIKRIIVAMEDKRGKMPIKELLKCRVGGINILDGNSFYEMLTGKLTVESINPSWLIFSDGFKQSFLNKVAKRITDIVCSIFLSIILLPIMGIVAIAIRLETSGDALFRQERVGQYRKPYMIYKFRSMIADAEKISGPIWASKMDNRITKVGRFIRKTRLDELPQLWNVLKGDMSFVGPRPERNVFVKQLEKQIPYYGERFIVKPGITGWAQVNYGYGDSIEDAIEKLNYDLFYIKNMSLFMDIVIIFRTVKTVFFDLTGR